MNDRQRLTEIVARAIIGTNTGFAAITWDDLTDGERADYLDQAERVIKALQQHGYLNHRGYPPDELAKYGVKPAMTDEVKDLRTRIAGLEAMLTDAQADISRLRLINSRLQADVVAAERERCAKVAESYYENSDDWRVGEMIAAEIRKGKP